MDFPLPNPDPCDTYKNMNSILEKMGFLGELSIMAYVDQEDFPDHLLDEYKSGGITIIHHPQQGALVTVFWDVQDRVSGVPSIGPALRGLGYNGAVFIRPYVDGDHQWKWDAKDACPRLHLDLLTRVVTKEAKVTRMLLDLLFWAMNNDDIPANFMLISIPDPNCDRVIKAVEHRGFFHILSCSDEVSLHLKSAPYGELLINQSVKLQGRKLREGLEHATSIPVFWLLEEDYPSNPVLAKWTIRSALDKKGYGDILSITVYVDERKFPSGWKDLYHKSGMKVVFIDEDYGLSKIDTMSWGMIKWRYAVAQPSKFVVIAKPFRDMTFDWVLEEFEWRRLVVLFEQPDYLFTLGSAVWSAKNLSL
ncbi:unnamed protein product [Arabis nemorensis]|uniref:NYN domain-containing protein n=1 Tax=Arabis nemorensis TaxID=586526 RepID=A0A565B2I7_9BRAS|nr:unnamed protein product [Arabis nemorensis]